MSFFFFCFHFTEAFVVYGFIMKNHVSSLSHSSNSYVLQIHLFSFFYFCWFYTDAAAFAATNYSKQKEKWKFRLLWQPFADSYFIIIVYVVCVYKLLVDNFRKWQTFKVSQRRLHIWIYIYIYVCEAISKSRMCGLSPSSLPTFSPHLWTTMYVLCMWFQ